jgi:AcrR family transcriptional regulator
MTQREKIIEAAMEAFTVKGIKSVTMDSIAQAAGVSKRTVYELFQDKDALVVETIGQMIADHNNKMIEIIGNTSNVIEAMFIILESEAQRQQSVSPMLHEDMKKYYTMVNEAYFSHQEKICEYSATYTFLQKGIEQGLIRKELRIDFVDSFLHELIGIAHNSDRLKLLKPTKETFMDNIFMPYFRGICTRKGLNLMEKYFENLTD